ncbi:MAG: phosphoesterase, PA-phosphatase-like protein [Gaiellaceae bacterium]|nr:phosphoesterase, PA-phosphatase-like protein [Gaiellaceae bacterium]
MFKHGLAAALAAVAALTAPAVGSADTVTQWNQNAANALYVTAAQPPNVSVLHMAMVQGAVYDAVNAIDGGRAGYLLTSRVATPTDSKDAAAATAAYKVLVSIVPIQQPALQALYNASLAGIPDGTAKTRGIAVGDAAAAAMIAARTADGRFGTPGFLTGTTPGAWRPVLPAFGNDPNAWTKDVKPFLLERASQFRSSGPYDLDSRKYARDFAEVKAMGSASSTTRTADQTQAALYWAENPPRTWNRIFNSLSMARGLSLSDNARLFAELYLTAADALIAMWDEKAHYSFWRPITAIREAHTDGNDATSRDENWLPLVANPPYPEHPSGHLGLSGSICKTLQQFFGTDKLEWSDTNVAGRTRSYSRVSDAVEEIVDLRVWSGLHFRKADEDAERIGRRIAKYRATHYFERLHD